VSDGSNARVPSGELTRVLIVSYAFPPALGSGIHRVLGWVRYLPQFGFEPVVLTARRPFAPGWDADLARRIPEGVIVVRTPWIYPGGWVKRLRSGATRTRGSTSPAASPLVPIDASSRLAGVRDWAHRHLLVPDAAVGWYPYALPAARRAVRDHGCEAIVSTSPYPTSHLVAMTASRRERTPWIADFRDLWSQSLVREPRGPLRSRFETMVDGSVLRRATTVTAASDGIANALRTWPTHPRVLVVRNGYDPDLTEGLMRTPPSRFTIVHTGRFYEGDRSPDPLIGAVAGLMDRGEMDPSRVEIRLVGGGPRVAGRMASEAMDDVLIVMSELPHREAIQEQMNASVLLLISGGAAQTIGAVPAKLYEYLAVRRPILALCPPDSEPAEIVRRAEAGIVAPNDDQGAIERALSLLYRRFVAEGDLPWEGRPSVVEEYARPKSTAKLADVLRSVLASDGPGAQRQPDTADW